MDDARSQGHDEIVTLLERAVSWLHRCVNGFAVVAVFSAAKCPPCHQRPEAATRLGIEQLRNSVIFWIDVIYCDMIVMLGLLGI